MHQFTPAYTIILAAGKGTRMGVDSCPKVCFEVCGVPAIVRALRTYDACGIKQHVIVVGNLAGQVIETIGKEFPNCAYVYQAEQLGTAHALRCAFAGMTNIPDEAEVLVVAGDRIISQEVLEQLFDAYGASQAELALLTTPCGPKSGQGRVARDQQGQPVAIIERADIKQRWVCEELKKLTPGKYDRKSLREKVAGIFFGEGSEIKQDKALKAFGQLWEYLQGDGQVELAEVLARLPVQETEFVFATNGGRQLRLTPAQALALPDGNTSVYVVKAGLLRSALGQLGRDNAQQEEYLSDLLGYVYRGGRRTRHLSVSDPSQVLGFNNPAELLEVERLMRGGAAAPTAVKYDPLTFLTLDKWLVWSQQESFRLMLEEFYSSDQAVIERQLELMQGIIQLAQSHLGGEAQACLIRSPGRLNIMGSHVDHQGGNCNLMTIGFETVMLAHPRQDDEIRLHHVDAENFPSRVYKLKEIVAELPWDDWESLVDSPKLASMFREYGVDWTNYLLAAVIRLQKKFKSRPLLGMDLFIHGNIPMAAGLSSSSSLVVGAAEAAVAVNGLDIYPAQLVSLCGESEWFVGTRGGSSDHAAVKMGQRGSVVKVKFFDFAVEEIVPFPDGYAMVVCDSGIKARKSSEAKNQFNHRVACYRIGFLLIKKHCPQYHSVLHHLRDVNTATLQVPLSVIYRLLMQLPESATRAELAQMLPDADLGVFWKTHAAPADGKYPIRGVVMYGLAEVERAALCAELLKKGDLVQLGKLMNVSHDGDRVVQHDENWQPSPFGATVDNCFLIDRLADLESGDPERVIRSQLLWQTGKYACSLPEIDLMVDVALRTPGVMGAQLAGAGLGGCMMVLTKKEAIEQLQENLRERYYRPARQPEVMLVCKPIAGASVITY